MKRFAVAVIRKGTDILRCLHEDNELGMKCEYPSAECIGSERPLTALKRLLSDLFEDNATIDGQFMSVVDKYEYSEPVRFTCFLVSVENGDFNSVSRYKEMRWTEGLDWNCYDEFMPEAHYEFHWNLRYFIGSEDWKNTSDWKKKLVKTENTLK